MKMFSILLASSLLAGCAAPMPEFPDIQYVYEFDTDNSVCARYKVVSKKPFQIKHDVNLPLVDCNTHTASSLEDFSKILSWKSDVEEWFSSVKCRKK